MQHDPPYIRYFGNAVLATQCPLALAANRQRTAPSYYILTNLGQRDEPRKEGAVVQHHADTMVIRGDEVFYPSSDAPPIIPSDIEVIRSIQRLYGCICSCAQFLGYQ